MAHEQVIIREGINRKPDEATAKVISLPVDSVPNFVSMKEFANWVKEELASGGNVIIKATGQEARFSSGNIKASLKRSRSSDHRNAYAALRDMVESAEYDHYEEPDVRHPDKGGQDVYHSALIMGNKVFSVRLKLDVVTDKQKKRELENGREATEDLRYKDHRLTEIEIAPTLYHGWPQEGRAVQPADAIYEISLGVLRGSVKPTQLTEHVLFQSAYHGTPHRFSKFTFDHIGTGEGAQTHGYGLYFAMDKEVADGYRERFRGRRKGQLYEVEIPESCVLLDEQKSLQEQPEEVQKALRSVFAAYSEEQLARIKKERLLLVDPRVWSSSEMGRLEVQRDRLAIVFNALRGIAEKPSAAEIKSPSNPFSRSPQEIYERRVERLRRFYSEEQIAAFQLGTDEWKAEMASMQSKMDEVNKQIFENNKILQEQANAYREKIIKASGVELLEMEDDGSWIYNAVVLAENGDPRMASIRLNEAGIKGITYDGETDGRCFVLFDEKSIEILKTFYQRENSVLGSYRQFSASPSFSNGVITFFESADISTAGHEIGHWLRQVLETSAILQNGQGTALNDWKAACDFVGADLTQPWSREQEEIFADAFVSYLKEGHAPNKFLARAFDSLKNWLTNLYARLTGNELISVSPEIAHVFDNLLTPEQQEAIVGQHRDVIKERILKATSEGKKPYSEAQAEAYADIVDCTLQAFSQRTGIDYQQVFDRLTPTFVSKQNAMDEPDQYDELLLQPAFHGTSYHFDKFSSKFIGEGAGEQSHGYGLYFSKAQKVADDYRKNHSFEPNTIITLNGKDYTYSYTYGWTPSVSEEERHILTLAEKHKNKDAIIKILQMGLNEESNLLSRLHEKKDDVLIERTRQNITSYQKKIDLLEQAENFSVKQTYGQLYEVEIPDDSLLLDEGKTFDDQPEEVQKGLRELGIGQLSPELTAEREALRQEQLAIYEAIYGEDEFLRTHSWFRPDIFEEDGAAPEAMARYGELSKREQELNEIENRETALFFVTGRHIYEELVKRHGSPRAASEALASVGIKGITYDSELDGRCFVIFDEKSIEVHKTFYQQNTRGSLLFQSSNQGERLMTKTKEKKNIVQSLADAMAAKLIKKLETGVPPWKKDWDSTGVGLFPMPYNPLTEKTYRGGNLFWLAMQDYDDPRWMTYNQAQSLGAQVKQGEKATQIVYWKTSEMQPKLDEEGNPLLGEDGKIIKQKVWLERPHAFPAYVFNAQQIEGLPPLSQEETRQYQWDPLKKAEEILSSSNAVIEHRRQNRAYYNHTLDKIVLPVKEQFPEAAGYYSTALHELSHWTGHEDRLNRDMAHPFGSEEYAKEELRAELASAVLCWEIGVPNQNLDNSAAYLQGWIKALKDDPKEILRAASAAEKIRAYVMDFVQEQKQEIAHSETIQDAVATPAVEAKHYRYYQPEHTYDGAEVRQEVFAFTDLSEKEKLDAIIYMQEESMFVEELDSVAPEEIPLESAQAVAASHDLLFSRNGIGFLKDECVAEEVLSQTKERNFQVSRQYLNVPFGEKEEAKQAGARWDRAEKAWFVPEGMNVEKFSRWIKKEECEQEKNIRPVSDRQYLYVPFKEKNEAKAAGAKWDPKEKCWYAPEGVDKNLLTRWMPETVKLEQSPAMTPQEEFAEALRSMGCVISGDHPIMDGKTHRIGTEEDRNGEKAGFYVAHLDGRPAGYIKNNRTDEELRWKYTGQDISAEVLQQVKADYHKRMEEKQAEIDAMQQKASLRCEAKFLALDRFQENESTLYMKAKDITAYTYESAPKIINKNTLCVPLTDTEGKIWSLQYIQEDGTKRFAKGSRKEGCYHAIYGEGGLKAAPAIVIAEGFATAATLAKTLGTATVATFTASNLESVAKALHEKYPDKPIVVAGDDDKHLAKNIGREKAEKAAEAVGGKAVFPTFALEESGRNFTDWNDLAVKSKLGYNGVRLQMLPVIDELVKRKQQEHQNDKEQQQGKSRSMNR